MSIKNRFTFDAKPTIKISRSKFDLSYHYKTSFNLGDLVPFYIQEIYPGDTFKLDDNLVIRTSSPLARPIMDNLFVDTYYFFVPNRIVQDDWSEVFGDNKNGYWAQPADVNALTIYATASSGFGIQKGTVGDKLGLPLTYNGSGTYVEPGVTALNILPFNAFAKIWNDWFRDENVEQPVNILTSVPTGYGTGYSNNLNGSLLISNNIIDFTGAWSATNYFGKLPKVNKMHDYFTSCLPSPQKGTAVDIPLSGNAVVTTSPTDWAASKLTNVPLRFYTDSFTTPAASAFGGANVSGASRSLGQSSTTGTFTANELLPSNLYADMSTVNLVNVNDLRFAVQLQRMLEKDARGGTRYKEYIEEHFGVNSPDARLQRPELLGGKRSPLSIQQTTSTTNTGSGVDQSIGSVGAFSLSNAQSGYSKGFTEHGFVIGVCVVRQFHSYQQGIDKFWARHRRIHYYDPVFANIGEQPVYQQELVAPGSGIGLGAISWLDPTQTVFGYNEAFADLRYRPSKITGELSSVYPTSLDVWHLGDEYTNAPILNKAFINETQNFLDRDLIVNSSNADQFILDCFHRNIGIRALPTYSIPGLVDHN